MFCAMMATTSLRFWRPCLLAFYAVAIVQFLVLPTAHSLAFEPTPAAPYATKAAVVLNLNARRVTQEFVSAAEDIVGADNVFATNTTEENDLAMRQIVDRGYGVIVPGGGDGTLSTVINSLVDTRRAMSVHNTTELPKFAFLPLGTGNAMGMLVGPRFRARTKVGLVEKTLSRLMEIIDECNRSKDGTIPLIKCPMIEVSRTLGAGNGGGAAKEGVAAAPKLKRELCFFAGSGFDSMMLDDFNVIKRWAKKRATPIRRFFGSVAGYSVALVARTLPACLVSGKHRLKVRVTIPKDNSPTYWMDPRRGDCATEVGINDYTSNRELFPAKIAPDRKLLFEGRTGIVAAGTTPYYGGGLKLFPFSRVQPHGMHLRLGRISPFLGFFCIPWIFRGTYRNYNMKCLDFCGEDFEVELSDPYPFQHSGEADEAPVSSYRLRVAEEEIEFVDFLKPRLVLGYDD